MVLPENRYQEEYPPTAKWIARDILKKSDNPEIQLIEVILHHYNLGKIKHNGTRTFIEAFIETQDIEMPNTDDSRGPDKLHEEIFNKLVKRNNNDLSDNSDNRKEAERDD